jgi:hypothetical protein
MRTGGSAAREQTTGGLVNVNGVCANEVGAGSEDERSESSGERSEP